MEIKLCKKCNIEKDITQFHKNKHNKDGYHSWCKLCRKTNEDYKKHARNRYNNFTEREKNRHKKYIEKNKDKIYNKAKLWRKNNKEYLKKWCQNYRKNNKKLRNVWAKNYRERNKIAVSHRDYIRSILTSKKLKKIFNFNELIGCTTPELKYWLEPQFDNNMDWDNYGSYWHIDHILPCAAFELQHSEEQEICFHYTNLRPLEAKENISKGAKII